MSDIVIVALIGAVPSIFGVLVGVWNTRKILIVHDVVNGGLTKARQELKEAREEIDTLKQALL